MREEAIKLENVKKSCSTAKKILGVFKILMIVSAILCFVGAAICYGYRKQINESVEKNNAAENFRVDEFKFQSGIISYSVNSEELIENGQYGEVAALACFSGGIITAVIAVVFALIQKIFVIIEEEESPFSPAVLRRIKKVFIAVAVIIGLEVGLGIGLFLGLFFWCLYCILDYGYVLQKEVDETL